MADNIGKTIEKEGFVSNLNGTSILEVTGIVSYAPLCCLFYFLFHTSLLVEALQRENWYDGVPLVLCTSTT